MHTGFSGAVQDGELAAAARLRARPERLELPLETLPAVGPSLARKLRPLGLATVGDLLFRRPRRYEPPADEVAISQLWGDEEVAIAGVVETVRLRRLAAAALDRDRAGRRRDRVDHRQLVQPAVARRPAAARDARAPARAARRGTASRCSSYDLGEARATADYAPVYRASEQVPVDAAARARSRGARRARRTTCSTRCRPSSELPIRRDALAARPLPRRSRRRPSARGSGSRSTSCVALQLAVLRSRVEGARRPAAPPRPASSSRATGRRCRSR